MLYFNRDMLIANAGNYAQSNLLTSTLTIATTIIKVSPRTSEKDCYVMMPPVTRSFRERKSFGKLKYVVKENFCCDIGRKPVMVVKLSLSNGSLALYLL